MQLLRDIGAAISPFNAFLFLQGLETLSLRMERHIANAQAVAEYLDGHDQVESVQYAGLPLEPVARPGRRATPPQGRRLGAGVRASRAARRPARSSSRPSSCTATWPTSATCAVLVIHPASTTHSQLTDDEQVVHRASTRAWSACRSGLESIEDILADLEKGFAAAAG